MSRGKMRAPARKPSPAAPRGAGALWLWITLALIAVVALAAWLWLRTPHGARAGAPSAADAAIAALTPEQAYEMGSAHEAAKRYVEALPYLRRATQGNGEALWETHCALAVTLAKVAALSVNRAGIEQQLARSSWERMQLVRECEREFVRARALAPAGPDRASVSSDYAEFLFTWGRMWEAFALFRQAQFDAPNDARLAMRADGFQLLLEHPERFATAEEAMRAEAQPPR